MNKTNHTQFSTLNAPLILMIEDNPSILRTNRMELELEGYRVLSAQTLTAGRELVEREHPDLILLDILLPDGNGLEYCRELFGQDGPRILFLSALNTPEDVITGLRAGGDDYMTKPYLTEELLARVEALLRRPVRSKAELPSLRIGPLELNVTAGRAYLNRNDLLLTPKELSLLGILLRRPGEYVASQELYEQVWGMDAVDTRPIRQHIRRLREKLGEDAPIIIESEQGRGYRIVKTNSKSSQNITLDP